MKFGADPTHSVAEDVHLSIITFALLVASAVDTPSPLMSEARSLLTSCRMQSTEC